MSGAAAPMAGACHCGAVRLAVPAPPAYLNACNCTLCVKLGALWGYYRRAEVAVAGEARAYRRTDVAEPGIAAHFCGRCGATTHWSPTDPARGRMGVNMRLFEPAATRGLELRFGDRLHHDRGEHFYRAPTTYDPGEMP